MKKSLALTVISLAAVGLIQTVVAGPERIDNSKDKFVAPVPVCDPRWYISIGGSTDFPLGNFSDGVTADINGEATLDVLSRDWDDVYSNWWDVRAEVGYVLTNHIELFGTFQYTHAESKIVTGSVLDFGNFDFEFVSQYGDYNSYGGELGLRYFFTDKEARIRPYVSISGGATFVDSIGLRADTEIFGTNVTAYDGPFYDDSIVGTVTGLIGIEFQVIPCKFSVGVDAGVRWQSQLDGDDSGFEDFATTMGNALSTRGTNGKGQNTFQSDLTTALSKLNNGDDNHFSIPVTVYAKFRF
jgi:hypothetical protein